MLVKTGTVLFKEGDRTTPLLVLDGGIKLTSTLGYSINVENGQIIGEWEIAEVESCESATALESSEIVEVEDEEVKLATFSLLSRAFKRIEKINVNLSSETKSPFEVKKVFSRVKKGSWYHVSSVMRSPYYKALEKMRNGDVEGAFEDFMKVDKRSSPLEIVEDSEIWKTYCLFELNPDVAIRRYNALMRRKKDFSKYVSFHVLEKVVSQGRENLPTMLELYFKHGMVIPSKTVLTFEGEEGGDAYFVVKGSPRVARYSSGDEVIIAFLGPGEMVGEISSVGGVPRTATVYTVSPLQVLRFESETLKNSVSEYPDFALELLKVALRRISRTKRLKEVSGSAEGKLRLLLELNGPERLNELGITISELSSYLGMSRKTVVDFVVGSRIGNVRSDGTVKFH